MSGKVSGSAVNMECSVNEDVDVKDEEENVTMETSTPEYNLQVNSPKTRRRMGEAYTSYRVMLQTTSTAFRLKRSQTRRRFSEFVWLRKELDKVDNWKSPPALPFKRFWNVLDKPFVEERRVQLEQWLHRVLSEPLYLSSTALHLFLQTEMSLQDIQEYLDGRMPEADMETIWNNQGKLYHYQPHNPLHNCHHQEPVEITCSVEVNRPLQTSSSSSGEDPS